MQKTRFIHVLVIKYRLRFSLAANRLSYFQKRSRNKCLLCRHAADVLSCLKKLDCEENGDYDMDTRRWQSEIGTAGASTYLCSDDARQGK